jgi:hypothetical protein
VPHGLPLASRLGEQSRRGLAPSAVAALASSAALASVPASESAVAAVGSASQRRRQYPERSTHRATVLERPEDEFTGTEILLESSPSRPAPRPAPVARSAPPRSVAPGSPAPSARPAVAPSSAPAARPGARGSSARSAAAPGAAPGAVPGASAAGLDAEDLGALGRRATTWLHPGDMLPAPDAQGPFQSGGYALVGTWAQQEGESGLGLPCLPCIALWEHGPMCRCVHRQDARGSCEECRRYKKASLQVRVPSSVPSVHTNSCLYSRETRALERNVERSAAPPTRRLYEACLRFRFWRAAAPCGTAPSTR